jgi:hypothetical protein
LIEPRSQPFKLVSSGDVDPVIELSGADLFRALFQQSDRAANSSGKPIGERRRKDYRGELHPSSPPQ